MEKIVNNKFANTKAVEWGHMAGCVKHLYIDIVPQSINQLDISEI
jgi:hypothetical protein